jgi:hypothetical protein
MTNLTLEEREKLKSDWQALKTKNEDAQLDREDNFVKDKVELPEESDIFYTPNPEYAENQRYMQQYDMYKNWAQKIHPDNIEEQNKFLAKKRKSLDNKFIYGEQITGGVYDAIDTGIC